MGEGMGHVLHLGGVSKSEQHRSVPLRAVSVQAHLHGKSVDDIEALLPWNVKAQLQ